jgi:hypothetical protein
MSVYAHRPPPRTTTARPTDASRSFELACPRGWPMEGSGRRRGNQDALSFHAAVPQICPGRLLEVLDSNKAVPAMV